MADSFRAFHLKAAILHKTVQSMSANTQFTRASRVPSCLRYCLSLHRRPPSPFVLRRNHWELAVVGRKTYRPTLRSGRPGHARLPTNWLPLYPIGWGLASSPSNAVPGSVSAEGTKYETHLQSFWVPRRLDTEMPQLRIL